MSSVNVLGADIDWAVAPASQLIDHIVARHHGYLSEALPRISQLANAAVQNLHDEDRAMAQAIQGAFQDLRAELESHRWKEEIVLFPLIKNLEKALESGRPAPQSHCGSAANPIRAMEHEHDSATQSLAEIRTRSGGYALPAGHSPACKDLFASLEALEVDLRQHISLENDVLFPKALALEARLA